MPETLSNTPLTWRPPVLVAAIALPFLACAALSAFRDDVTAATSVLVLVLIVVGAAATGDRLAGLLAALASGAWFDFFLVPPYHRFAIDNRDDVEATLLLVVISIAVSEVALWGHRQQARASRRSGYLEGVLDVARAVAEGDAPSSTVTDLVAAQITEVLDVDGAQFVKGPVLDDRFAVLNHDGVLTRDGSHIDVDRVGLPSDEYTAVPVRRGQQEVGHFLLTAASHVTYPTREQRRVAVLLADQVAAVDVLR